MQRFTNMYFELDATNRTGEKVEILERYFVEAPPRDAAWALLLFSGQKLMRATSTRYLREWVSQETGYPPWLVDESYHVVGDLSETLALLLPDRGHGTQRPLHELVEHFLLPLSRRSDALRRDLIVEAWRELDAHQRFIFHKFLSGSFRVGVSRQLITRALAGVSGLPASVIASRLAGGIEPTEAYYERLLAHDEGEVQDYRPYPFFLAHPFEGSLESLGDLDGWQIEYKWDGIRSQLIHRRTRTLVYSRGEENITDAFPEVREAGAALPDGTVLDGEVLAWEDDRPLPFALLQRRLNRKHEQPRLFAEIPVVFMAYDLLELNGQDIRERPLAERRAELEALVSQMGDSTRLKLSPIVRATRWDDIERLRQESRGMGVEGVMIKGKASAYGVARPRGDWWKYKVDPHEIDAVLIAAQPGSGKRANLFTDYTFGVWRDEELVPVAKAYSGLTDDEIREIDRFVRRHTLAKHGPVRVVQPVLVFQLAFERVQESTRHKAGLALRFPRIARWRRDKTAAEADTVESLRSLLNAEAVGT
ncbi:MAG TPA: ATP-dependent DNA ligase [Phycisphaerae bacterium]|nr:ATP-dependent DNA ligase [Phycisphaerae bacterium]